MLFSFCFSGFVLLLVLFFVSRMRQRKPVGHTFRGQKSDSGHKVNKIKSQNGVRLSRRHLPQLLEGLKRYSSVIMVFDQVIKPSTYTQTHKDILLLKPASNYRWNHDVQIMLGKCVCAVPLQGGQTYGTARVEFPPKLLQEI